MGKKQYYGTKALADLAGLTQERIRQLIVAGEIRGQKVGRDWIVERDEAERWLRQRGVEPDAK